MSKPSFRAPKHPLLVPYDGGFRVSDAATDAPRGDDEKDWKTKLAAETTKLGEWQYKMFADGKLSMLLILQAMDAAGKDGAMRHVLDGVNPCGLRVASFKQPSRVELSHDFLWRTTAELPRRGELGVFNRSYYEEVIVVRVHPQYLAAQAHEIEPDEKFWEQRYRAIVEHERHLAHEGTIVLKFWLNISKEEQRRRLLARIDEPDKQWKFNAGDLDERERWDDYQRAYEDCLGATSRPWAPWYAIPADDKDYARWQIAKVINGVFERLDVDFPKLDSDGREALQAARARLTSD